MAATTSQGTGPGAAQSYSTQELNKAINAPHYFFANPDNDDETIPSTVTMVFANTAAGSFTLNMPSDSVAVGRYLTILNNSTDDNDESVSLVGNFFVNPSGYNISPENSITFTFDGAYWWIIGTDS